MALKITLKPHEKMILGGAVIANGNSTGCHLIIENKVPILREKDILSEKDADSPCRRLYFIVQSDLTSKQLLEAGKRTGKSSSQYCGYY